MSLNRKKELINIAKTVCRELRKKSTLAEKLLWEEVRNRKYCNKKFYRQYPIFYDLTGKESFFVADFYCYEEKLIVELDGEIHQYMLKKDEQRTDILNCLGLRVIRFTNDEIMSNLSDVLITMKQCFTNSSPSPFS